MGRIPEEVLERIKQETDLPSLFQARGASLVPTRSGFKCLCLFHRETEPSSNLNRVDGVWVYHCFGCQREGNCFHFVMETEGVSFTHAVELLSNGHGRSFVPSDRIVKRSTIQRLPSPVELTAEDHEATRQVMTYYHERLNLNPDALSYLRARQIDDPDAIDQFQIGFSDRTLGLRLPDSNRKAGAELRERLKRIGIYRENGREHFLGSIVIPIVDDQGRVTEAYGRKIGSRLRPGTPKHLYLPGPHRGIWNHQALSGDELILCESLIDALSFWCQGIHNITATYGVTGLTEEIYAAIVASPVHTIRFAFDNDKAGDTNAAVQAERFRTVGKDCFRIVFPRDMDANEYVCKVDDPQQSLLQLINGAVWMGNGTKTISVTSASLSPESSTPPASAKQPSTDLIDALICGDKVEIDCDNRHYRIFGLSKNMSFGVMRITMRLMIGEHFYDDELNLYKARSKENYVRSAALEVGCDEETIKRDLAKIVLKLEALQEAQINKILEPTQRPIVLTEEEREEALKLLKSPDLIDRIIADYEICGVVGEQLNVAVGYLAGVSRLLAKPLGVIIQSSSAAGKTYLMDAILAFMPAESVIKYSAMTGQSLYYMGETELKHKILAIEEQEGAEKISYSLKLLLSEGRLVIKSTGKDPQTGRHEAHDYTVEGPMSPFSSTTCLVIHDELQNRLIILTMNEGRDQTREIQRMQRWLRTLEGRRAAETWDQIKNVHQNAQRLLRPLEVINPHACSLTFLDNRTRTRRDQLKYLTLIDTIALLHQYQRPAKSFRSNGTETSYVEVTLDDIELANRLASEMLGRSLDELPPHTRLFLTLLDELVTEECTKTGTFRSEYRFTRRFLCDKTGWSYDQVRVHIERLVELEYVLIHRGGRGQQCVYELLYDGKGKDGKPFMVGLIDVEALRRELVLSL